jgi:AraC family transcriptional regulator of adaptative response/methylated-DNA-[protein]-cysteine methyltransferase
MYEALLRRDASYEGLFVVGVTTTGVFCRPTCSARKPKRENVQFFRRVSDAVAGGFRPCRRCKPMHVAGDHPDWLDGLLAQVDDQPSRRWTDRELSDAGVHPVRLRRWFKDHHGITFQAYSRMRRLTTALAQIREGQSSTAAALEHGYQSLSGFNEAVRQYFGAPPREAAAVANSIVIDRVLTPLGPMVAGATEKGLCLLEFSDRRMLQTQFRRLGRWTKRSFAFGRHETIDLAQRQLDEYFRGDRQQFKLPLDAPGTKFQSLVWRRLLEIPYGQTLSYDQVACAIGHSGARRAVGRANGDNRLAIVIPCHRVIRHDGTLSGYGGGLWRKQWLLDLEQR